MTDRSPMPGYVHVEDGPKPPECSVVCPDCRGGGLDSSGSNECQLCGGDRTVTIGDVIYDSNGVKEGVIDEKGKVRRER